MRAFWLRRLSRRRVSTFGFDGSATVVGSCSRRVWWLACAFLVTPSLGRVGTFGLDASRSFTLSCIHSLTDSHSPGYRDSHSLTLSLCHLLSHSLTHSLTHSVTHSVTHSLADSLVLAHSCAHAHKHTHTHTHNIKSAR